MPKLLIIENNAKRCKNLINEIAYNNLKLKIFHISNTVKEAINFLRENNIDIIWLNINIFNGEKIIKEFNSKINFVIFSKNSQN